MLFPRLRFRLILVWFLIVVMLSIATCTIWTWNDSNAMYYIHGNRVWVAFSYHAQFCLFYEHIRKDDARYTGVEARGTNESGFRVNNNALYRRQTTCGRFPNDLLRWGSVRVAWADELSAQPPLRVRAVDLPLCFFGGWSETFPWTDTEGGQATPEPGVFVTSWIFPHWFPFLCCAAMLWVVSSPLRHERRIRRLIARGLCPTCGYDLRAHLKGEAGDKCLECGKTIDRPATTRGSAGDGGSFHG